MAAGACADGAPLEPVHIAGRKIASTAWGTTWCAHIEGFHDYSNRLPRGRSYVRNGSVIDLVITKGEIRAQVVGSKLYKQVIAIRPCKPALWKRVVARCKGSVGSLIEILSGRISESLMSEMTADANGILPDLSQIKMSCSCPDWASLCKHLAAVLYGVGARLDEQPELLFMLRGVDPSDLLATVDTLPATKGSARRVEGDLSTVFGIDLDDGEADDAPRVARPRGTAKGKAKQRAKAPSKRKVSTRGTAKPLPEPAPSDAGYRVRHRLKRSGEIETRPAAAELVTRQDLLSRGIAAGTISGWVRQGILRSSGNRGVYEHTATSKRRVRGYQR